MSGHTCGPSLPSRPLARLTSQTTKLPRCLLIYLVLLPIALLLLVRLKPHRTTTLALWRTTFQPLFYSNTKIVSDFPLSSPNRGHLLLSLNVYFLLLLINHVPLLARNLHHPLQILSMKTILPLFSINSTLHSNIEFLEEVLIPSPLPLLDDIFTYEDLVRNFSQCHESLSPDRPLR